MYCPLRRSLSEWAVGNTLTLNSSAVGGERGEGLLLVIYSDIMRLHRVVCTLTTWRGVLRVASVVSTR